MCFVFPNSSCFRPLRCCAEQRGMATNWGPRGADLGVGPLTWRSIFFAEDPLPAAPGPGEAQRGPKRAPTVLTSWGKPKHIPSGLYSRLQSFRNFWICPKSVWICSRLFWAPQGPGMAPTCGPGDQLLNAEVSSKSGQWRPDWWQKCVLRKSQQPIILGASYSDRMVPSVFPFAQNKKEKRQDEEQ